MARTKLDYIVPQLRPLAVPVEDLNFDDENARKHDDKNLQAIEDSFLQFGQRMPIVVQKTGMVVRAGNGRLMAARRIGWTHLAAVVTDDEDDMAVAFALADNRTAELAEWDSDALAAVLVQLSEADYNTESLGWSEEELEKITAQYNAGEEELPELEPEGSPFAQITLTFTHDQMATVKDALKVSKGNGAFGDTGNPNSNGNAAWRVFLAYLDAQRGE